MPLAHFLHGRLRDGLRGLLATERIGALIGVVKLTTLLEALAYRLVGPRHPSYHRRRWARSINDLSHSQPARNKLRREPMSCPGKILSSHSSLLDVAMRTPLGVPTLVMSGAMILPRHLPPPSQWS